MTFTFPQKLQKSFEDLVLWTEKNDMQINIVKMEIIFRKRGKPQAKEKKSQRSGKNQNKLSYIPRHHAPEKFKSS
jgi:hypothetical protein